MDSEYRGVRSEPLQFDPEFDGPLKNRSCTDVLCLGIFLIFIAAWAGIGTYAITYGDPSMLLVPKDSYGRRCGIDFEVKDKPYLFFFDLTECLKPNVPFTGCPTKQVCVKECPDRDNFEPTVNDSQEYCVDNECPKWYLKSTSVLNRCLYNVADRRKLRISRISKIGGDEVAFMRSILNPLHMWLSLAVQNGILIFTKDANTLQIGQNIVEDIMHNWWKILIGIVLALLTCIIYIMMLRWIAAPMVWFSIIGALVALAGGIYFSAIKYKKYNDEYPKLYKEEQRSVKIKRDLWLTGLIILSVVTVIILLIMIFLRKRILLAIALIKEGSKAVSSVTASLFFPIFPWLLQAGVIVYAIVVALFLTSTGKPLYETRYISDKCTSETEIKDDTVCNPDEFFEKVKTHPSCLNGTCKFIMMENDALYPYLQAYNVVGFFWLAFFVSALAQMVLAGIFAQWYWTWNKRTLPFFAVTSALGRTLSYHIGTLAFGSLIITICRLIRVLLEYVDRKVKMYDNELTKAIMCCCKCLFYCLEKFLKFINKNAYIMCAIHGKNFCASASDAFSLLMRNIIRVFVLDKVTDFLFFLSKLLLTLGVGAVSYVIFDSDILPNYFDNSALHYGAVPVAIIMIATFLISSLFFSVYSMAVDTLFLCFLEDCERNDGSSQKPYYMSKNLMKIFGKKNKLQ